MFTQLSPDYVFHTTAFLPYFALKITLLASLNLKKLAEIYLTCHTEYMYHHNVDQKLMVSFSTFLVCAGFHKTIVLQHMRMVSMLLLLHSPG